MKKGRQKIIIVAVVHHKFTPELHKQNSKKRQQLYNRKQKNFVVS